VLRTGTAALRIAIGSTACRVGAFSHSCQAGGIDVGDDASVNRRGPSLPALELRLIEGIALVDGRVVPLPFSELSVLVAVALARRPLYTEEMSDVLWPDLDLGRGRRRLRLYALRVRRRLGRNDVVVFDGARWHLGPHVAVEFLQLEALVARLPAFPLANALRTMLQNALGALHAGPPPALADAPAGMRFAEHLVWLTERIECILLSDACARGDHLEQARIERERFFGDDRSVPALLR
jgi:hypothetical protein